MSGGDPDPLPRCNELFSMLCERIIHWGWPSLASDPRAGDTPEVTIMAHQFQIAELAKLKEREMLADAEKEREGNRGLRSTKVPRAVSRAIAGLIRLLRNTKEHLRGLIGFPGKRYRTNRTRDVINVRNT